MINGVFITHGIDEFVARSLYGICDFHLEVPLVFGYEWDFFILYSIYRTRDTLLFIIILKNQ
jgi:hypothetical protein